jgi:hypothetical protein
LNIFKLKCYNNSRRSINLWPVFYGYINIGNDTYLYKPTIDGNWEYEKEILEELDEVLEMPNKQTERLWKIYTSLNKI